MRYFLLTAAVFLGPSSAVHAQVNAQMPPELIGVWFSDDPAGEAKCAAYLALPSDADTENRIDALIGGTVIAPDVMHDVAEYGEGNFYELLAAKSVAPNEWNLETHVSFDTKGHALPKQPLGLRMTLDGGRLNIVWTSAGANPDFERFVTPHIFKAMDLLEEAGAEPDGGVFLTQCTRDVPAGY